MRFKIFTLILLMLSLSSCTQSFFYNRLDTLFNWYIDDYIELDQTQQQSFDVQLNKVLQWHRSEELNRYIQFLKQLKVDIKTPINRNMIDDWSDQVLVAYERVEEKMFNLFTTTIGNLSQQQVDNLMKKLRLKHNENKEKYLNRNDKVYTKESAERITDNLERFLGPLSKKQIKIIETKTTLFKRFDEAWLEERELWYVSLENLLKREAGWQLRLKEAYYQRNIVRTKKYLAYRDHNIELIKDMIIEVFLLRDEKQNRYIEREIDQYVSEFEKIIAETN